jgi:hypothetical protein
MKLGLLQVSKRVSLSTGRRLVLLHVPSVYQAGTCTEVDIAPSYTGLMGSLGPGLVASSINRPVTEHLVCQSALNFTGCLLCFWCLKIKCRGVEGTLKAL